MNCGCGNCSPLGPGVSRCSDECPCPISAGIAFVVKDENCDDRLLEGSGIAIQKDGDALVTDGSTEKGVVPFNPDSVNGVTSLVALVNGAIYKIGEGAPEGSSITRRGGQWIITSLTAKNTIFDPKQLRTGAKTLAGFGCGSDGMLNLASVAAANDSFIYWDADGVMAFITPNNVAAKLLLPLCEEIELMADTETISGFLVCTENGVRKANAQAQPIYWLDPKELIYYQGRYSGVVPSGDTFPIPAVPAPVNGPFVSETVDVDLTAVTGYSAKATAVILDIMASLYNGSSNSWNLVVVVDGLERVRLSANESVNGANGETQIWVPIPANKKIRIQAVRQTIAAGSIVEAVTIAVRLTAFVTL